MLSPFNLKISLPVAAYISPYADSRCPVVCPRSSQSSDSQPPNFFTVIYPPSRPAHTPAFVRKLCRSRFTSIDAIQAESRSILSRNRLGNKRMSFKSKPFITTGALVSTFIFPTCWPGYMDCAANVPAIPRHKAKIIVL